MKLERLIIMLIAVLAASMVVSAQEAGIDELKQKMENSAGNLTKYTYIRSVDSKISYHNDTIAKDFQAEKKINGKVDLTGQRGWWGASLKDKTSDEVLTWEGYFLNGSEYWKEGQNWTKFEITDKAAIMGEYNELPGQVDLIDYSDMKIAGTEMLAGEECYKLVGSPATQIYRGMIGLQLLAAYFPSPFPLPEELRNESLDIDNTGLIGSSRIELAAWVSKNSSLLKKMDISSTLTISPAILNITLPDFRIQTAIIESTVYSNFGSPVQIVLPPEASNTTFRMTGTNWRWAVFGSVRP